MRSRKIGLRRRLALNLYAKLHAERVREHELRTLFWETTLRCNLSCRHCGSDCRTQAGVSDMPLADFLRVIDSLTPHVDPNHLLVIFSGGEPLVRSDIELCGRELYDRGYPWGLVTNGMLLDNNRFRKLLAAGLRSISISLDGFEPYHNWVRGNERSFAKALAAARMVATEPSIKYDVVTCVSGRNAADLPAFKEFLVENGIRHWRIFTIFPVGRAAQDPELIISDTQFSEILDFIEQTRTEGRIAVEYACEGFLGDYEARVRNTFYTCRAGVSVASIRVDGAISGCTSIRANFDQGNIYSDDFWTVWNERFENFRNRAWAHKDQCADCEVFKWCGGGGMHLRDEHEKLLVCHYHRLNP